MKIFVSHVNAHYKVTSTEEDFNDEVDKIITLSILWIPVNLLPQSFLSSLNGVMSKGAL